MPNSSAIARAGAAAGAGSTTSCARAGNTYNSDAVEARPNKIKALVAVEPAGIGDAEEVAALKNVPVTAESYLIMDRNNLEVAGLIQKWLAEQPGLYK